MRDTKLFQETFELTKEELAELTSEELAEELHSNENNYNNCDKTSGMTCWNYHEIFDMIEELKGETK